MGAWFQNIGVKTDAAPESLTAAAAAEGMWLPTSPTEGWSWLTLKQMLDHDDFDRLVELSARQGAAAAVGFGVFDEDSAYLVGASPCGIEARLVFDAEAFDSQFEGLLPSAAMLARGGAKAFAAWSASVAPRAVSASAVKRFCEDADPLPLLEAAGLYPRRSPDTRPAWERWMPRDFAGAGPKSWDGGGHSHLVGEREYAILAEPQGDFEGPPGPWIMFLVRETLSRISDPPVEAHLTFLTKDTVYTLRGRFENADQAKEHFGASYSERPIRDWTFVPDEVGRNRAETVAWLVSQAE
jgi:hypothetical protein